MKKSWSGVGKSWVYELEGGDITTADDTDLPEFDLTVVVRTGHGFTEYRVPVARMAANHGSVDTSMKGTPMVNQASVDHSGHVPCLERLFTL